jgi:hypothetical protein
MPVGQAFFINRGDNPPPQVQGKRQRHACACRPADPADILNQKLRAREIPQIQSARTTL